MAGWFWTTEGIHEEPDYERAYEYFLQFVPKDDVDYEWVATYAEDHYRRLKNVAEELDHKADSVIRIFASGSGLLSLGAILNLEKFPLAVGAFWSLGLFFALAAVVRSGWVRYPKVTFLPPSVGWAIDTAEKQGVKSRDAFLAQWHLASEGLRLGSARKAQSLKAAMQLGLVALTMLALSFPVGLATLSLKGSGQAKERPNKMASSNDSAGNGPERPAAPNPATQPQTPTPGASAGPQMVDRGSGSTAGPQAIESTGRAEKASANSSSGN